MRDHAADTVVAELDGVVDVATSLELMRVAVRLMQIADSEPIGPGTARMTVAGAAVYAADRLTEGKAVTQAEMVDAVARYVLPDLCYTRPVRQTYAAR